jgi:hypothetical protein
MSTKILVLISAILILVLAVICIFVPMVWQQPTSREYSQFPATEVLLNDLPTALAGPSSIISINWYTPDKIIIDMAFSTYDGKSHPLAVFDISSGETSPLTIKGRTIYGLSPTISPNGQYLAIDAGSGIIQIIPVEKAVTNEI